MGSGFLRPPIPADYDNKGPWPKPSHRARIAFEIGHRSLGWLTVGGGVAECALGIIIVQRNGNDALPYVRPGIIACLGECGSRLGSVHACCVTAEGNMSQDASCSHLPPPRSLCFLPRRRRPLFEEGPRHVL